MPQLTQDLADRFAAIALGHVEREYPNKLDHVLASGEDALGPRALHPIFYGSFDWHSCVHGYWLLARILRRFPAGAEAGRIVALFDRQLTPAHVAGELAYLHRPESAGFERPYGWAWLLKLQAELTALGERRWAAAVARLAEAFSDRFVAFLPKATYPVRAGTHGNTAFALRLAHDYARAAGDEALGELIGAKAVQWYGRDEDCAASEPSGDDFLSPALMEAELMRAVLPAGAFADWLDRFLPMLADGVPEALFEPAVVSDPADGKIAHLDGLNLSRAWCFRSLAAALASADPRRPVLQAAADRHLDASLPAVSGHYMGEHWLASFALLALEAG
jgi:hypothetical protein